MEQESEVIVNVHFVSQGVKYAKRCLALFQCHSSTSSQSSRQVFGVWAKSGPANTKQNSPDGLACIYEEGPLLTLCDQEILLEHSHICAARVDRLEGLSFAGQSFQWIIIEYFHTEGRL
jgi:hypothetical protein